MFFDAIVGLLWNMVPSSVEEAPEIPRAGPVAQDHPEAEDLGVVPRRAKISKHMVEKYGYSDACVGCRAIRTGRTGGYRLHSEDCRRRLEARVAEDQEESARHAATAAAEQRQAEYIASRLEAYDKQQQQQPPAPSTPPMPPLDAWPGPGDEGGQKRRWAEISEEELFTEEAVAHSSNDNPENDVTMGGGWGIT